MGPCTLALVLACGKVAEVEAGAAQRGSPFPGVPFLAREGAPDDGSGRVEQLLDYRWSGHGAVPWPFDGNPELLPFGPVGRTPSTLLYLTFDGPLERETAAQARSWRLDSAGQGAASTLPAGRFGGGVQVSGGKPLVLRCDAAAAPEALTVELWIRPEDGLQGPILLVPGWFELTCMEKGVLHMETRSAKGAVTSGSAALTSGRWSHVGVVIDPAQLQSARLVLDGEAHVVELSSIGAMPPLERLELGGGALAFALDELRASSRAANTSELVEDGQARPQALERLELSTTGGARSLEVWTSTLREPVIEDAGDWARGELEHVSAGADGLRWAIGHWRRIRALDPPLARTCHPTVYLGNGSLFVFSGEVRDSHLNPMRNVRDTWMFHTRTESWERLATSSIPPGRCHQQAAYSPDDDLVLMSTGWGNGPGEDVKLDDTWVFHVGERRWEERHPSGSKPGAGGEHALVYHPRLHRFLMFQRRTIAEYDAKRDTWTTRRVEVVDEQGKPSGYKVPHSQTAAYDPIGDRVVLFGGQSAGDEFHDRTLLYEPDSNRLVVLDPPAHPSARVRPGFAYDERRQQVVLFGGVLDQFSQRMDDLWSFDPARRRWTRLEASGTPSARGGYMLMAYDRELDRFFLVGGRHSPERFLEEVWSLSLDERAEGHARYAFDRAGFPAKSEWFWKGESPGDSAVEFRFRGSEDGLHWGEWSSIATRAERYLEVDVTLRPSTGGESPVVHSMGFR